VEIREVSYDDPDVSAMVAEVQRYYVRVYGGPDTSPVEPGLFARPDGAFFVGRADAEPVAMGGWRLHPPGSAVFGHRTAEIKRMYVVEAARGRGFARAMLGHLERTAIAAGADAMILETGRQQPEAIALYQSAGYAAVPRFGHYAHEPAAVHLGRLLAVRA
jgi:ribosomal protein S18 acetylase RimI-like enzyme